jgi:hypothetical protein
MSHQVDPVPVDLVLLPHALQNLHHVLLAEVLRAPHVRIGRRRAEPPPVRAVHAVAERRGEDVAVLLGERWQPLVVVLEE